MLSVNLSALRNAALPFAFVLMSTAAQAQDALSVVDDYLAALNAQDSAAAAALLAVDASYYDSSVGKAVQGSESPKTQVIDAFLNAAPDAKWGRDETAFVDGDHVAFEWTFSGTNICDWSDGTAATDKPFSFEGMTMITVTNGEIRTQSDYYDILGFYAQLGLM
jgi:steroid delta-isomerase-like uncharacterized protein